MKKPVVDYRSFRLSKWKEAQYSHLKLLSGWIVYLLFFVLTEKMIQPQNCCSVHCPLDDAIPFCEVFVIPYVLWYVLIVFSLVYFALYDIETFRKLSRYLMIVQAISIFCYIVFPTRQDLRPSVFPRDNILVRGVQLLYRIDTNTGVCPSFHVSCSIAIATAWWNAPDTKVCWKWLTAALAGSICLSTMFIKQHSAVDFFAALPVCALAHNCIYGSKRLRQ